MPPVIVVGGGAAGLSCAVRLVEAGLPVELYERGAKPGGRLASDVEGGHVLDHGFQIFLDSYPEARMLFGPSDLRPSFLPSGARVVTDDGAFDVVHPLRHPLRAAAMARRPPVGPTDAARLACLAARLLLTPDRRIFDATGGEAARYLLDGGFTKGAVDRFFRPFFAGVFLDPRLSVPASSLLFVLKMFVRGRAALPAGGIGAVAERLARLLPDGVVRTGSPVSGVGPGHVTLSGGERREASAVVVACDAFPAPGVTKVSYRSTSCFYYSAPAGATGTDMLVVDGRREPRFLTACDLAASAPGYAPPGRSLVSVSVLGDSAGEPEVRSGLVGVVGRSAESWEHVRTFRIRDALPAAGSRWEPPPSPDGVFRCGDATTDPSLNGALRSGRLVARRVVSHLSTSKTSTP